MGISSYFTINTWFGLVPVVSYRIVPPVFGLMSCHVSIIELPGALVELGAEAVIPHGEYPPGLGSPPGIEPKHPGNVMYPFDEIKHWSYSTPSKQKLKPKLTQAGLK